MLKKLYPLYSDVAKGVYIPSVFLFIIFHILNFSCVQGHGPPPHPAFRKAHLSLCYVTAIDKYELMEEPISIYRGIY